MASVRGFFTGELDLRKTWCMTKVNLTGVMETMLVPLLARAKYSRTHPHLMQDLEAIRIVKELDYDFSIARRDSLATAGVAARTILFDDLVSDFIRRHPGATVVNLACGLDTRFPRVDDGTLCWYNLDLPEVMEIRARCIPPHARVKDLSVSVLDAGWPSRVVITGEVLVVIEGLVMYFTAEEVRTLMAIIRDAFPRVTVLVETLSPMFRRFGRETSIRASGARFTYGCRGGEEFCRTVAPGFRSVGDVELGKGLVRFHPRLRWVAWCPLFRMLEGGILAVRSG